MISQKWLLIIAGTVVVIYFLYKKTSSINGFNGNTNGNSGVMSYTPFSRYPRRFPMYYTYPLGTDPNAALDIARKQCAQDDGTGIPMNEFAQRYNSETFLNNNECQPGIDNRLSKGIVTRVPSTGGAAIDGGFGGMRGGPVDYNDTIVI